MKNLENSMEGAGDVAEWLTTHCVAEDKNPRQKSFRGRSQRERKASNKLKTSARNRTLARVADARLLE